MVSPLAVKPHLAAGAVENSSRLWGEDGKGLASSHSARSGIELETREIKTAFVACLPCLLSTLHVFSFSPCNRPKSLYCYPFSPEEAGSERRPDH